MRSEWVVNDILMMRKVAEALGLGHRGLQKLVLVFEVDEAPRAYYQELLPAQTENPIVEAIKECKMQLIDGPAPDVVLQNDLVIKPGDPSKISKEPIDEESVKSRCFYPNHS